MSSGRGRLPLQQIRRFGNRQIVWLWQIVATTNSAVRQSANRLVAADCRSNIGHCLIGHCRSLVIGTLVIASGWVG
ncbi:MAG: hypothetical protein ACO2PK_01350 [Armatimonadota bacterium]